MSTVHCVDVSGSVSDEQLTLARVAVRNRFKPKDIVVLFDCDLLVVTDLDRDFGSYPRAVIGRGGSNPEKAVEFANQKGYGYIIYTDGYISKNGLDACQEIVIIK